MSNEMLCPMTFSVVANVENSFFDCAENACAWWDEDQECCAMKSISRRLSDLAATQEQGDF